MEKNILVVNIGSTSKKYSLYRGEDLLLSAHFEKDKEKFDVTYTNEEAEEISEEIYINSLSVFREFIRNNSYISDSTPLTAVGVRLVAPGEYFTQDHRVDVDFLQKLDAVAKKDLAHIGSVQTEMVSIQALFPNIKLFAISDSFFHSEMPEMAKTYAIPKKIAQDYDIYRFGFHGISVASIIDKLSKIEGGLPSRIIVCHLGGGASMTAVENGKSIDTSMGHSPLEGLVMSSRVGNIGVGAVLDLLGNHSVSDLERIFYKESGLLAVSELSDDMRILLDNDKEGHVGAHKAVETFIYNVRKYIGAYSAIMGGIDALIFSGTIGERSFILRERICRNLSFLGFSLDNEKNNVAGDMANISHHDSKPIYVTHTDESKEILKRTIHNSNN